MQRFFVAVAGVLILMALLGPAARAAGCAIAVEPEPGWPGASLHVIGTGFEPGADITVYLGDFPVYDGFIDDAGGFGIEVRIPTPFDIGDVGIAVIDHTDHCGVDIPYAIADPPAPRQATTISVWQLALLVAIGAGFGFGVAGLAMHRRSTTAD